METKIKFMTQYVAPFLAGVFLAAASMAPAPLVVAALVLGAVACGYVSFPIGDRLMRRLVGSPA